MKAVPKVSILCITFNHEKYIAQTLESFLIQKTDFPFEVIIHDDASTDKTADIIRKYESENPGVFRPVYEKTNQFRKVGDKFVGDMFRMARGKYIAFCEGDDYWLDPNKLQLQVDFLEKHTECALCFHPVKVFFEGDEGEESTFPAGRSNFTTLRLLQENFIQTNSVMYRRRNYEDLAVNVVPQDWYLHLYHAQFGQIGFINRVMSAYRRHSGGVWWEGHKDPYKLWNRHGLARLKLYVELQKLYQGNPAFTKTLSEAWNAAFTMLAGAEESYSSGVLRSAIEGYPEAAVAFILHQNNRTAIKDKELAHLQKDIDELKAVVEVQKQTIIKLNQDLERIRSSRLFRLLSRVKRLIP